MEHQITNLPLSHRETYLFLVGLLFTVAQNKYTNFLGTVSKYVLQYEYNNTLL